MKISLRAARVNAEMTQAQWADHLGVTIGAVLAWESGKDEPKYSQIKQISKLSGIPEQYLKLPTQT